MLWFGRGAAIRTRDLLNPIQVRYRTALRPDEAHASIRLPALQEGRPARRYKYECETVTASRPPSATTVNSLAVRRVRRSAR